MNPVPVMSGLRLEKEVSRTPDWVMYRGVRESDGQSVLIKLIHEESSASRGLARLRQEFETIKGLDSFGVIKAISLEPKGDRMALVMENFQGRTLRDILGGGSPVNIRAFIRIALELIEIIDSIHKNNIIHKNLTPENIFLNTKSGEIKIADFQYAYRQTQKKYVKAVPGQIDGTPAYMSPEQSGRIHQIIDYRSDYYSLGVIFYEMLTGQVPFRSTDPMELVYAHLAKEPEPPHRLNSDVPEVLSQVVLKLMSRSSDERYQSAIGINSDLQECLSRLRDTGGIDFFFPGQDDIARHLNLSQKLYGRDNEISQLTIAFKRVCDGVPGFVFIEGEAGVGKTVLAGELNKPVIWYDGFFLSGKCEQHKETSPYDVIMQALRELIGRLGREEKSVQEIWKQKILKNLGSSARLLTEHIPELESLLGEADPAPQLPPEEARYRFQLLFSNFLRTFATVSHPVVIFLDDVQWADPALWDLLEVITSDSESLALLFVCAYRPSSLKGPKNVQTFAEALPEGDTVSDSILLENLDRKGTSRFLADTLDSDEPFVEPLADYLYDFSRGNPLFIKEYLRIIYRDGYLWFNAVECAWNWDLETVTEKNYPRDLLGLFSLRFTNLEGQNLNLIKWASCLGNIFEPEILRYLSSFEGDIVRKLRELFGENSLIAIEDREQSKSSLLFNQDDQNTPGTLTLHFEHNLLQEAAYSKISPEEKQEKYLKIGRVYIKELERIPLWSIESVTGYLNQGLLQLGANGDRLRIVYLNYHAGKKCLYSGAYGAACNFFETGLSLMSEDSWQKDPRIMRDLHREGALASYLTGRDTETENLSRTLFEKVDSKLDRMRTFESRISSRLASHDQHGALELAALALKEAGMEMPLRPKLKQLLREKYRSGKLRFKAAKISSKASPLFEEALRILGLILPYLYLSNDRLFNFLIRYMYNQNVERGDNAQSALVYIWCALKLLGNSGRRLSEALVFADRALELVESYPDASVRIKVEFYYNFYFRPWKEPLQNIPPLLYKSGRRAQEYGEREYAVYAFGAYILLLFFKGENLENINERTAGFIRLTNGGEDMHALQFIKGINELQLFLREGRRPGDSFMEEPAEDDVENTYFHAFLQLMYYYQTGEYSQALEAGRRALRLYRRGAASIVKVRIYFYISLSLVALRERSGLLSRGRSLGVLQRYRRALKRWMRLSPENNSHFYYLVEAEVARTGFRNSKAIYFYENAIRLAREHGFQQDEALAYELAAGFYFKGGRDKIGRVFVREAREAYLRWGARSPAQQLEERYSLSSMDENPIHSTDRDVPFSIIFSGSSMNGASIGPVRKIRLAELMENRQAIAGELNLQRLYSRILEGMLKHSGMDSVTLLLKNRTGMGLAARKFPTDMETKLLDGRPLEMTEDLPRKMIRFVMRTKQCLVINDVSNDSLFDSDPWLIRSAPGAVICMPVLEQGRLFGVLYLETPEASVNFNQESIEMLCRLSSQIVVSINNARLYGDLEEKSGALGRFVPEQFLESLNKPDIKEVHPGDVAQKEMTLVFSDIRKFNEITQGLNVTENFNFLNSYLRHMSVAINNNGGFIDRYIGDAVMALFPEWPENALEAALDMRRELDKFNGIRKEAGQEPIEIGIGLHTGSVMLGILGFQGHLEKTVIGDTVMYVSYVESLAKRYRVPILVTGDLINRLKNEAEYNFRAVDMIRVKGKDKKVRVYELFDVDSEESILAKKRMRPLYQDAFVSYRVGKFKEAKRIFEQCRVEFPEDYLHQLYLERCEEYIQKPPKGEWSGVTEL